jgi:hypothetical protein
MKKIDAILNVYGLNALKNDLSVNFRNEEICAWAIENISKEELLKQYSKNEILFIYYHAV